MKRRGRVAVLPIPSRVYWLALLALLSLLLAMPAHAEDPPARAGRISDISGEAWIFDSQSRDWERLARNQTVAEGDRLRSDGSSRVTLRIGSTTLWLDERSELEVERMDDERVLLRVERGSLALKLRSREQAQDYRVLTREGRLFLDGEGMFRVDQMERGTRANAWQGRARFEFRAGDAEPVWLAPGEQAELWWSQGPRTERQAVERDNFARWLQNQREAEGEIPSYRYVSPEMTGAEDLDRYGRWDQHAEFGAIWYPTQVAVDWAPYQYGRWAWTVRWGWTWVDAQPWGFAPFHYGRWVRVGSRWCWAPGRYVARPVYAPALVAWSSGPHLSVGVTIGSRPPPPRPGVWVPLAPREVYQPHYRHTPNYRERINRDHDPVYVPRPGDASPQRPQRPRDDGGAQHSPGQQPGRGQGGTGVPRPQPPQVTPPLVQPPPTPAPQVPVPQRPVPPRPADPESPRVQRGEPGVPMSAPERAWQQTEQRNERNERVERADSGVPMSAQERAQQRNERLDPSMPMIERRPERVEPERRFDRGADRPMERGLERGLPQAPAMAPPRPTERQIERPVERPMERSPERAMPPPAPVRAAVPQPAPERARSAEERNEKRGRGEVNDNNGKREQQK